MLSGGPGTKERISVLGSNRARSGEPLGLRREMGTFLISHCGTFAEPNTRRETGMSPFRSVAEPVLSLRICIDVSDLDTGIRFYERALGLTVTRRLE